MTRKELKDAVSLAVFDALDKIGIHLDADEYDAVADAALAVVREALREPSNKMVDAGVLALACSGVDDPNDTDAFDCWLAQIAASPLSEGNGDG